MANTAGFDTAIYPGNDVMDWLNANTNLAWCGYYLAPAPSHGSTTWMGNLAYLNGKGWQCVPIYLGQQTIGPGSHNVTAAQGGIDGADAANLANSEGFPAGAYIYLDVEDGSNPSAASQAYIKAWAQAVLAANYSPGIYCSHLIANTIVGFFNGINPNPNVRIWAWKVTQAGTHNYNGDIANIPANNPAGSGFASAYAWQFEQNCMLALRGGPMASLQVDLSCMKS